MNVLEGDGATVTVDTGAGVTVTVDVPVLPSLVAVIVVVPGRRPVTTPACETVATAGLLEVHETTRPLSTLSLASFIVALSVAV
jgi:MinD-like ATPase involved in chromosome partitioning or flagellar assembly